MAKPLLIVLPAVALLFAGFGSGSVAVTLTVLETGPAEMAVNEMVTVEVTPGSIVPRLQVTALPLLEQLPWVAAAETTASVAGKVSVTVTLCAGIVPLLATSAA